MKGYLIDANVTLAFMNKKDPKHAICNNFLKSIHARCIERGDIKLYFPIHSMIEANVSFRRKKRNREVETIDPFNLKGAQLYNIDRKFLAQVEKQGLYEKFDKLKGVDAIYAMVAYIEDMNLVTMDNDFDKVADTIKVIKL